jgi:hypothetical protein
VFHACHIVFEWQVVEDVGNEKIALFMAYWQEGCQGHDVPFIFASSGTPKLKGEVIPVKHFSPVQVRIPFASSGTSVRQFRYIRSPVQVHPFASSGTHRFCFLFIFNDL